MGGSLSSSTAAPSPLSEEQFKTQVRGAAAQFKNLLETNKVMIFSATYCSYCDVAKRTLDELGTQYGALEVNKEEDGAMLMNVVSAVTGNRAVPAIFICGQLVPGGGSGLRQLATSGQLTDVLKKCCGGDVTCSR